MSFPAETTGNPDISKLSGLQSILASQLLLYWIILLGFKFCSTDGHILQEIPQASIEILRFSRYFDSLAATILLRTQAGIGLESLEPTFAVN